MIAGIFIILLLFGFFIFNPFASNADRTDISSSSSILSFSVYCCLCVGVFYAISFANNSVSWRNDIVTQQETKQDDTLSDFKAQNKIDSYSKTNTDVTNSIDFEKIKSYAISKNSKVSPIRVNIHPLSDYDGKSKAEIFSMRKKIVESLGFDITEKEYNPTESILGAIQDGKPWWGTEGILCKGEGQNASDGMSRESSYFNNPLILLNLGLSRLMNGNEGKEDCAGLWPQPTDIIIKPDEKTIYVEYDLSGFMKEFEGSAFYESVNEVDWFEFGSINARDFGYTYAQAYQTQGIRFAHEDNVGFGAKLRNYWCLGRSCMIEGGCNNICPSNAPFSFFVTSYPAYAYFKLYKNHTALDAEPDAYFQIVLK